MKPAPGHGLQLALGLAVWSVWFVALYGGQAVGCALAPPAPEAGALTWLNAALAAPTLATCAWLVRRAWLCRRAVVRDAQPGEPRRSFIPAVGAGVYLAAAISTLAVGVPLAALPPCT